MPVRQIPGTSLEYYLLNHDSDGREVQEQDGSYLSHAAVDLVRDAAHGITDVFLMSHGWQGDVPAAIDQYDRWSAAMAACTHDRVRVRERWPDFKALTIGFHWPSLAFGDEPRSPGSFAAESVGGEEEFVSLWSGRIADTPAARDALRTLFRAAIDDIEPELLSAEVVAAYHQLEREAQLGADGVSGAPDADRDPLEPQRVYEELRDLDDTMAFSGGLLGGLADGLLAPLRIISFWRMKRRALAVGESGGHRLLERIIDAGAGRVRIHLMGHSFGCIACAAMIRGDDGLGLTVNSALLVQGAMSLWSWSSTLPGSSAAGYFRSTIDRGCVTGPIVVTTSRFDRAVGVLYPKAAGSHLQVAYDTAPARDLPKYGAIGAFGIQGNGLNLHLRLINDDLAFDYQMRPGQIYNVHSDSVIKTGGGFAGAHSDIAHAEVGHLLWEAVLATS